jgi:hypothetical protein
LSTLFINQRPANCENHSDVRNQRRLLVLLLACHTQCDRQEAINKERDATARPAANLPRFGITGGLPRVCSLRPFPTARTSKLFFPKFTLLHVPFAAPEAVPGTAAIFDIVGFPSRPILLSLAHSCGKESRHGRPSEAVDEQTFCRRKAGRPLANSR